MTRVSSLHHLEAARGVAVDRPGEAAHLERLPRDPWGSDYQYLAPGVKGEIDVFSLGADQARGGDGNAADIGNWE